MIKYIEYNKITGDILSFGATSALDSIPTGAMLVDWNTTEKSKINLITQKITKVRIDAIPELRNNLGIEILQALSSTDYTQLLDSKPAERTAWADYRAELRALLKQLDSGVSPDSLTLPTKPF